MAYIPYRNILASAECRRNRHCLPRCNHQSCWSAYFAANVGVTIAVYTIVDSWKERGREEVVNKRGKKFLKFFERFLKTVSIAEIIEEYKKQRTSVYPKLQALLDATP